MFVFSLFTVAICQGKESLNLPIEEVILKNGLKIILVEEHKAPVATIQVWYRVGSRNELTGKTGLSHLMEHMMFKGTPRFGKGAFSRNVQKNGGNDNAFTAQDYTAYFENISSGRIALALELESDRMAHLLIDPKEFQLERDVVKEERRMRTDDNPADFLSEQLYAQAYVAHPYHSPVIGWMTDLDHLTRQDIFNHYKKYYVPNNATLIIVGDFNGRALLPEIKKYFEPVPVGEPVSPVEITEPDQKGERRFTVKKEAQMPVLFFGYKTPNYRDPDHFPLILLSTLLSSGKSSRLYRQLVYEKKLALEIGTDYSDLSADPSLFTFYAKPQQGKKTEEVEAAILSELDQLKTKEISEGELQKIRNQIETQFILNRDSNFFIAMQLGIATSVGAGAHYFDTYLDSLKKVSPADIQRVARKYFSPDSKTVGTLVPVAHDKSE
ncbi:MAG: insulinase family protein [Nitrospirae bacterium]|nr:insulinase family protein [Nitrospirota bacterium]MBI3594518.1 insulinase family protein [Nitrospirota bacterium]